MRDLSPAQLNALFGILLRPDGAIDAKTEVPAGASTTARWK
jgi:hypothetical protein